MIEIDVGADPIDRKNATVSQYTYVEKHNPANASGILHTVKVYANSKAKGMSGLRVGTFYVIEGSWLKCRDSVLIGDVIPGSEQTFTDLSIDVQEGDYIGCYFTTGALERDTRGYVGNWYKIGEWIDPGDDAVFGFSTGYQISLYGIGEAVAVKSRSFGVIIG